MITSKVNMDQIVTIVLEELKTALNNWSSGQPINEEALMNHITGRICRKRRKCNIGLKDEVTSISESYLLHRQGPKQTDLFGSDLAVTISMPEIEFSKTACFQIKIGSDCKVKIEKRQIEDAKIVKEVFERCYVLGVDSDLNSLRLLSVKSIIGKFKHHKIISADTTGWKSISQWLIDWFTCKEGPMSNINDPNSIEKQLDRYKVKQPDEIEWDFGKSYEEISNRTYYPAKAWTKVQFDQNRTKK